MTSHLVIPDVQVKPGVNLDYLKWIGAYIAAKKPDVIVCLGDFADMHSLSSYDKGKKSFEGRRYKEDIETTKIAMDVMLNAMRMYNAQQLKNKKRPYRPRMVMCLGNHEQRIDRLATEHAELDGLMSYDDLPYQNWEIYDFLDPVEIDGVTYVHYLANPFSGKPYVGNALNQLTKVGKSFIVGHKQTLDIATRFVLDGSQQWGIVAGAAYPHHEDYKGHQGNYHWRGILYLHRVQNGSFDPTIISLDYLKERYNDR